MLDVAIIGAGAAGLGAAKAAQSKGLTFKVLEAASFAGGRARTDTMAMGMPFDLGCRSFYGDTENPFLAFARESGSRLGPVPEKMLFHDGSAFLDAKQNEAARLGYERLEAELLSAHEKLVNAPNPRDRSQADVIDSHDPIARYFLPVVQLDHAGAASEVSLLDPTHRGGTDYAEVLDGYGALILRAAAGVPVSLNCPVSAIDLSGPFVVLDTPKGQLQARRVVLTVSTAVLAAERIVLRPGGWPNQKVTAIDGLPMASVTKVGIRLKPNTLSRDFDSLLGEGGAPSNVFCSMNEPENALWTLGAGGGDQALVYLGGSFSRELALAGEAAQIA